MAALPSDADIRARAELLGELSAGAALDNRTRARIGNLILEERAAAAAPSASAPRLLSSLRYPVEGGEIRVEVTLYPTPASTPTEGQS